MKACKTLYEAEEILQDVVVLVDEMYLKTNAQFCRGTVIDCDEDGEFYKNVIVFMIQGLKRSVPLVVKGVPVTALNGEWLAGDTASCITTLCNTGFRVLAVVTDNHAANVKAFATLHRLFPGNDGLSMKHPESQTKTYLFFDNVHIMKNVRNNLMNVQKFVFVMISQLRCFLTFAYLSLQKHSLHTKTS